MRPYEGPRITSGRLLPKVLERWEAQREEMKRRALQAMEMAFLSGESKGKVIPFRRGDR